MKVAGNGKGNAGMPLTTGEYLLQHYVDVKSEVVREILARASARATR
ncbi:MAG: hypothetical protein WC383_11890 [Gammaproteobacteria bacterium]